MRGVLFWVGLILFPGFSAASEPMQIVSARSVVTMDPARPYAEAFVINAEGRIVQVGSRRELDALFPDSDRQDFGSATIVPGLIDAHGHLLNYGLMQANADLVGTTSKADVLGRLRTFARELPKDAWLVGRGWDQNDWPEGERQYPGAADLDRDFPDRPVWLERVDGHAYWANTAAMRFSDRELDGKWQVPGGEIVRSDGRATGIFVDAAATLIESKAPPVSKAMIRNALQRAFPKLLAAGLTGVHDAGTSREVFDVLRGLAESYELPIRVHALADGDAGAFADRCREGPYRHVGGRLQMRGVKLYMDGALGSRGALMSADYSDQPGTRGLMVTEDQALKGTIRKAMGCGLQVATHAIGDRGNRIVLDLYAEVLGKKAGTDHRWRIEHAQILALDDIARFAGLGVIASMQPTHATSDMPWAELRVGPERITGGYAWRRFRDAGVRLAFGSDFPVERIEPLEGLYAAITRQDALGQPDGGWYPEERLTAFEALRGFTIDAAHAGFMEQDVGSITKGKRADFVVLSGDPVRGAPASLLTTRVLATWLDGEQAYAAAAQ